MQNREAGLAATGTLASAALAASHCLGAVVFLVFGPTVGALSALGGRFGALSAVLHCGGIRLLGLWVLPGLFSVIFGQLQAPVRRYAPAGSESHWANANAALGRLRRIALRGRVAEIGSLSRQFIGRATR